MLSKLKTALTSFMAGFSKIKSTLVWVAVAMLVLSVFVNYKLFHYSANLKGDNQELTRLIDSQEDQKAMLVNQIQRMETDQFNAQYSLDEMLEREQQAREQLQATINELTGKLENESCYREPIAYPINWLSNY